MVGTRKKDQRVVGDDQALMALFQHGDESAFERLVRRWEKPMLGFFHRAAGNLDEAEDLRQDLFVRLYQYRASYRGTGSFRAWLYQLATNLLRTRLRQRKPVVSLDGDDPDDESARVQLRDGGPAVDEVVRQREAARLVRELLAELPSDDREALVLRFYEGLPYHELCEALQIAESSAKSRVYRAVEKLRRMMVERGLCAGDLI